MKRIGLIVAAVTALIVVATYLVGLRRGFANGDEALYGELVRAMHRSGDWLTLRFPAGGLVPRPALPLSLIAGVAWFVPGEQGMRLLPTLIAALVAIGSGALVARESRDLLAAAATTAFVAAVPTMHCYGRLLSGDPLFAAALLAALAATMRAQDKPRAVLWIGVAAGAAVATRSLGALLPLVALLPWIVRAVHRHGVRAARLPMTVLAFLGLALPYYVIAFLRHGQAGAHLDDTLGGELADHALHLWSTDGPATTIVAVVTLLAGAVVALHRRDARLAVPLGAAGLTFLGLGLAGTRLPLYPMIGVAAGMLVARLPCRASALAAGLALLFLWRSSAAPAPSFEAEPAREAMFLADSIHIQAPGAPRIYTLDWYAPALGYYADLRWTLLATSPVPHSALFAASDALAPCPPWPAEALLVAGTKATMTRARAQWPERFASAQRLSSAGDYQLWRVNAAE